MRKIFVSMLLVGLTAAAAAADVRRDRELHLGIGGAVTRADSRTKLEGQSFALGLTLPWRESWSVTTTLSREDRSLNFNGSLLHLPCEEVCIPISPIRPEVEGVSDIYSLDLVTQYDLPTDFRWRPYVGLGARIDHVEHADFRFAPQPFLIPEVALPARDSTWGFSPGMALGFGMPVGRVISFRLDGRYNPKTWFESSDDVPVSVQKEARNRSTIRLGLGWRF